MNISSVELNTYLQSSNLNGKMCNDSFNVDFSILASVIKILIL